MNSYFLLVTEMKKTKSVLLKLLMSHNICIVITFERKQMTHFFKTLLFLFSWHVFFFLIPSYSITLFCFFLF